MKNEKDTVAEVTEEKSQTSAELKDGSAKELERQAFARTVRKRLPRRKELGKKQQEFYSVNGRNFLVKLGEDVDLPEPVANLIEQNKIAEDAAYEYEASLPTASAPDRK